MQLKIYQQTTLDQLDRWLDSLKDARLTREKATKLLQDQNIDIPEAITNHPLSAWENLKLPYAIFL